MISEDSHALDLKGALRFRLSARSNHNRERQTRRGKTRIHFQVASVIDADSMNWQPIFDVVLLSDLPGTTDEEFLSNNVNHARFHHLRASARLSIAFKEQFAIRIR